MAQATANARISRAGRGTTWTARGLSPWWDGATAFTSGFPPAALARIAIVRAPAPSIATRSGSWGRVQGRESDRQG